MFLQQYDFDIKYRKGVLNKVADALSREQGPRDTTEDTEPLLAITEDDYCPWYRRRYTEVETAPETVPEYCIRDGRLYRHMWHSSGPADDNERWKLCVPKPLRPAIMRENHDDPTVGHLGIAKTTARIARNYYWPGMFRDVAKYVRRCQSCLEFKVSQQGTPGRMQPSPNEKPWATVCTDLVGPLPRSSKGNTYHAVFQDRFTKWVQCRPIRKPTAAVITKALYEEIIVRFGCPDTVISDNGAQYTSRHFRSFLTEMGIRHRLTPPYTPQANPVERTNKTLKTMIAQFCDQNQKKWDAHLPELAFALNTVRHDSTGFSPAYLNYGRELEIPKAVYRQPEGRPSEPSVNHSDRLRRLENAYELVRVNLARAFTTQSHGYNLRRREWRCHIGDRVMKREFPLSSAEKSLNAKLAPKFSGPHTVTKVISPVVYELTTDSGSKIRRVHVKDLKPVTDAEQTQHPDSAHLPKGRRAEGAGEKEP